MASESPDPVVDRMDELEARARQRMIARSVLVSAACLTGMVMAYYLVPWGGGGTVSVAVRVVVSLLMLVTVAVLAVREVLRSASPVMRAIEALAVVVGLAILSFASLYLLMSSNDAAAFTEPLGRTDALYFSMTTTSTVGYGDISAKSEGARIVVMLHMLTNVVVVGVAARALLYAARRRTEAR